ncbi:MAG: ribosomal protein S18-alanine N-acetyltransferase [Clostridia bacterium]|nr:ribosomal protein S18-alanine N-acetyltransferase [Clostridia bacterium]
MEKIKIEKMTLDDIDEVLEVCKNSFPIPWSRKSFEEEMSNMLATYLVAKLDDKVVGFIGLWFVMDECHITNIAVHNEYRNKHIATELVNAMFEYCKEHETSYVLLEVRSSNVAAKELYKKFGFKEDVVRKDYYKNPDNTREDAIVMSLEIRN